MALIQITQSSITHDDRHVSNGTMINQGGKKYKTVLKNEFLEFFYWCIARSIYKFFISISATDFYNPKMSMNPAIGVFPFKNIPEYGRKNLTKPIKVFFILLFFFKHL